MWVAQQLRLSGVAEVERRLTFSEMLDWEQHYSQTGGMSYAERVIHARLAWSFAVQNWDTKKAKLPEVGEFIFPPQPDQKKEEAAVQRRDIGLVKSLNAQVAKLKKDAARARELETRKDG